jgi:hypothetical protein
MPVWVRRRALILGSDCPARGSRVKTAWRRSSGRLRRDLPWVATHQESRASEDDGPEQSATASRVDQGSHAPGPTAAATSRSSTVIAAVRPTVPATCRPPGGPGRRAAGELLVRKGERVPEAAEHVRACRVDESLGHHREAELVSDVGERLNVRIERLEVAEVTRDWLEQAVLQRNPRKCLEMQAPIGFFGHMAEEGYEQVYDVDEIITRMPTPQRDSPARDTSRNTSRRAHQDRLHSREAGASNGLDQHRRHAHPAVHHPDLDE